MIHQLGCPKEADPRNEVCGCERGAIPPRGWESVGSAPGPFPPTETPLRLAVADALLAACKPAMTLLHNLKMLYLSSLEKDHSEVLKNIDLTVDQLGAAIQKAEDKAS